MSVPAHAPFDYIALRDCRRGESTRPSSRSRSSLSKFTARFPAKDAVERAGILDQNDPAMKAAHSEIYSGRVLPRKVFAEYGGKPVREARDEVAALMMEHYGSITDVRFDDRHVICRCGGRVFVKISTISVPEYSDPCWKEQVKIQLEEMVLVPPEVRAEFERTSTAEGVGLHSKGGSRHKGSPGIRLDRRATLWIQRSTIGLLHYRPHHLEAIPPEKLTPEVFDYIFLARGSRDR